MTEERPSASNDAPAPGTLATLGLCTFVAGLALGLFQPLAMVGIGVTLVAGPTYAGLLFLLCVLLALVMGGLAFFGARWFTVPAFAACGSLALGLFAGNWAAASFGIGFASNRPAAVMPTFVPTSPVPIRVVREAPATVVLRLDGVPGFTPNAGDQRFTSVDAAGNVVADGVFGQWCYSPPRHGGDRLNRDDRRGQAGRGDGGGRTPPRGPSRAAHVDGAASRPDPARRA